MKYESKINFFHQNPIIDKVPEWSNGAVSKTVKGKLYQGLSLTLRHHILLIPITHISATIPAQDQGFTIALYD